MNKRKKYAPLCTPAIILVHGKSELQIAKHICCNLRLNCYIHHRTTSIQVNGVVHELETNFPSARTLVKKDGIQLNINKDKICGNFKIFAIMDTDDCDEKVKSDYISAKLFSSYALGDYVVPIYNSPNLEHVLFKSGLIPKIFNDSEKVKQYATLFPVRSTPVGDAQKKLDEMKQLSDILKKNRDTNFYLLLDYLVEEAEKRMIE